MTDSFQDPDALLATLKHAIAESIRQHATPFASIISSISIGLRQPQDHHGTAAREFGVYIYTPSNEGNISASYQRLEGYIHNLQPKEKARFVRLVDRIRGEMFDIDDDQEDDFQNNDEQDADGEDDDEKTAELEKLREQVKRREKRLNEQAAYHEELQEEVAWYRRHSTMTPPAFRGNANNADEVTAGNGAREADDAEDNAGNFDHGDPSVDGPELLEDAAQPQSSKKPTPTRPPFTHNPKQNTKEDKPQERRSERQGSKANEQSETTSKPTEKDQSGKTEKRRGTGVFRNGYEWKYELPKSINEGLDPEEAMKKGRDRARQQKAEGNSSSQSPEDAATGTSAAGQSINTLSGQAPTRGSGRKQSQASTKPRKSKNDHGSEADYESAVAVEEPRKTDPKQKRKVETSEEGNQPTNSKKLRRAKILPPVEEESDNENRHVHAAKGSHKPSVSKAKLVRTNQSAKRKIARDELAESDGGMSDPICISSGEDTDSETEDED